MALEAIQMQFFFFIPHHMLNIESLYTNLHMLTLTL